MKKKHRYRPREKTNSKKYIIMTFASISLAVFSLGITYSRYITTFINNQVLVPENFYFESNYLLETDTDEEIVTYNVYTGYVDIEIRNHDLVQYAENDIKYTIEFDTGDEDVSDQVVKIEGKTEEKLVEDEFILSSSSTVPSEDGLTEYAVGADSDTFRLTADEGATVTVTATSSDPYEKTITAVFKFQDPGNSTVYEIVDMGYYCYLNIYTGEDLAEEDIEYDVITIQYVTEVFSPDNQNPIMEDWKIDTLYIYEIDEDTGKLKITTTVDGELNTTEEADDVQTETIAIYEGDTGKDDAETPEETELVPNGYYSLVFFENTLGDYTLGQTLLDETTDYTITMPTNSNDEDE